MTIRLSTEFPDENDVTFLTPTLDDGTVKIVDSGTMKKFVEESLGGRLLNVWTEVAAEAEEVFREEIANTNDPVMDYGRLPWLRIALHPGRDWFETARVRGEPAFGERGGNVPGWERAPTLSLWLNPPIPHHVNGPMPAHYCLTIGLGSNDAAQLASELWVDFRRTVLAVFEALDISTTFNSGDLARRMEKPRPLESRLRMYFRKASVWRPIHSYSDHEDLSAEFIFGFPFCNEFGQARRAFTLLYMIYSSIVETGVGDRDKMGLYWAKLMKRDFFPLTRLTNHVHAHPVLRLIHRS